MKKMKKILKEPKSVLLYLMGKCCIFVPDEPYVKARYYLKNGEKLNLKNPKTFNEKMQWLKLHNRKDIYTKMVDKYEAKKFVAGIAGEKYIIPTLGIYKKFDDIDFDKLPKQFVIKCTHNSGGFVICKDKSKLDLKKTKKKINKCLKKNYYYFGREWPYNNVKPRIIVERYVKDDIIDDLRDYKFICFNGEPKYVYITVKNDNIFENYYDMDFKPINIDHGFPRSDIEFEKPKRFSEMKKLASKLSKDIPFLRVDLHYVNGKVLFGEMTFYDWSGSRLFAQRKWDKELGDLIDLSSIKSVK